METTIADIYELSPMQQGMLFHTLYDPNSGIYFEQRSCLIRGHLNLTAFHQAWQRVVERHNVFRTAFHWQELEKPLQVVHNDVKLPWQELDWRNLEVAEQQAKLTTFLLSDRTEGFDLQQPPLMRCTMIQLQTDIYQFVWSHHHLLMDGWCNGILLKEVFTLYEAFCQGQDVSLPFPTAYRNYILWLQEQNQTEAEIYWRKNLQGFTAPTPLVYVSSNPGTVTTNSGTVTTNSGTVTTQPGTVTTQPGTVTTQPGTVTTNPGTVTTNPGTVTTNSGTVTTNSGTVTREQQRRLDVTTTALQTLARQHYLTLNTLIQGAWALLLSRYSGETDVVFGTTVSGRPPELANVESIVGLFINTLPVRVQIDAHAEIIPWLEQLQTQQVEREQYAYSSLVEIQGWSEVPNDIPLFESLLVFENYPVSIESILKIANSHLQIQDAQGFAQTNYPLTLAVIPGAELLLQISYASSRFDEATIERLLGHLETLLTSIVANPRQKLSQLSILTSNEQELLKSWNQTTQKYSSQQCIHQLFEAQVEKTPDAVAVIQENKQLTYRELNQRANQLAHYLKKLGVKPEVLVGICLERSITMIVGLLGILKAGGVYVPLDPAYPQQRLAFMISDSRVSVLLTQESLLKVLPDLESPILCLDADWELKKRQGSRELLAGEKEQKGGFDPFLFENHLTEVGDVRTCSAPLHRRSQGSFPPANSPQPRASSLIALESQENLATQMTSENLAYAIYTSGSTGIPKGVMVQHQSLVNYIEAGILEYDIFPSDRILQFASISFDAAAEEIFPCLVQGATLVLRTDEMLSSIPEFLKICGDWQLTVLDLPTAFWHQLVAELLAMNLTVPDSVRLVIIGGEKALPERLTTWQQLVPKVRLVNGYGPTEATIVTTTCDLSGLTVQTIGRELAIGKAVKNAKTYILDSHLNLTPVGVPGELYIGGIGVTRGYLNRPDLTAVAFIPDLFSEITGARLYKTGDRVRYLPDGNIEYLGRFDNQVKVRGFRIELGEIEALLSQYPDVQECAVVACEDMTGDKRLIAYIAPLPNPPNALGRESDSEDGVFYSQQKTDRTAKSSNLRQFMANCLPGYMIPAHFVFLSALPRTPNGKIDRKALPQGEELPRPNVTASTPSEELLVGIWQTVLNLKSVGIEDNFFALGGDSLLVIRMIAQIQQVFGVNIPLRQVFETPTIAELARVIASSTLNTPLPSPPLAKGREYDRENLPLSFAQQRLWLLAQLEPDNPSYNVAAALRLSGNLDVAILRQSFTEIVRRHQVLRTSFPPVDGRGIAVVSFDVNIFIPVIDLSSLSASQQHQTVEQLARCESQQPFNLEQSPLLRVNLLYLHPDEHVLLLTIHHIITDGWSVDVLAQEIATFYQAFSQGQPSPLPELAIQYADFAAWQRQWLQDNKFDYQLEYWRQQLQEVPKLLELPIDYPRPAVQTFLGRRQSFELSLELTQAIKQLRQETNTTLFMVIFLALSVLLHRYSNQDEIVIGSPIANRHYPGTEGLIGFFANTLALRISLADNPSVAELLPQVREIVLAAYAHQDVPFEQVVEILQPLRSLSHSPLFQVMLVVENAPAQPIELTGLRWSPLEIDGGTAKFDLTLMITQTNTGLQGKWEYNCDLFAETTITRFTEHLQTLLTSITSEPTQRISDLSLMKQAERKQIISFGSAATYHAPQCIHELFEEQVAKFGDVIACVDGIECTPPALSGTLPLVRGGMEAISSTLAFTRGGLGRGILTYAELNSKANQLAHYLKSLGVKPEVGVGICVERSVDFLIGILGILKAGGFYVPLDVNYPSERLAFLIQDAQVQVLLTQEQYVEKLPFLELPIFCFDNDWQSIAQQPITNPVSHTTPENLAYVMYTSGSTGVPKGVCVPHRGVVRLVQNCDYAQLSADEILLQAASVVFDASTFEIWGALLNGARLVILPSQQPTLEELANAIAQYQITTLWLTAGLFHLMVDEHLASLKAVKQLLAGGDVLSAVHIKKLLETYPQCRVINGYGPTEGTTFTCCYVINDAKQINNTVSIGRAIANTQVYILDRYLNPVPIGIAGELYIAGDGLARGYVNRADVTAERFVPNPFIGEWGVGSGEWGVEDEGAGEAGGAGGERITNAPCPMPNAQCPMPNAQCPMPNAQFPMPILYKTGDRARYLRDGNIEYLGRLDNQVKIRGFRIELGEIESVLAQHPSVQDCVVIADELKSQHKQLVAYFVQNAKLQPISPTQLRQFLQQRLPDYLIPSFFIPLETLPLTPNGKVDRRMLPAPELPNQQNVILPRTDIEAILVNIWSSLLHLPQVGIHDNFFELGGDSILAIQVISRANQTGLQLTPKQLFQYQTIAELAAVVTPAFPNRAQQGIVTGSLPLTPIQHWFFEQELANLHHFNQAVFLQAKQKLQPAILISALKKLLQHHDVLRSRFAKPHPSSPYQGATVYTYLGNEAQTLDLPPLIPPCKGGKYPVLPTLQEEKIPVLPALQGEKIPVLPLYKGELEGVIGQGEGKVEWLATIGEMNNDIPYVCCDLSALSATQQEAAMREISSQLQGSLNITHGLLLRVANFDLGEESRLLIVIHHLVVDAISWRILLEDLQTALSQLIQGKTIDLPPKTTAFAAWAKQLYSYSSSTSLSEELDYWLSCDASGGLSLRQTVKPLPVDYLDGSNTVADADAITISLSVAQTQALIKQVPSAYNTQINDVLLTACTQAISTWTKEDLVLIDLENYGRDFPAAEIDVSRTVGWFTVIYPLLLQVESNDNWGEKLKAIKEQLRRVPNRGFNYGLLRYLSKSKEISDRLQTFPSAEVSFNYLGQLTGDRGQGEDLLFTLCDFFSGTPQDSQQHRRYRIEINGFVRSGQLQFEWIYSRQQYQKTTISQLATNFCTYLQEIITHCQTPDNVGYTPSDFELANLDQQTLDQVLGMVNFEHQRF
ncbi:amino acid adenylation domain-containing protein [Nostoc sp. CHAB 5784]|uniref:non-ribosomal peptide synthetase n=1 Tax=Nostoc mirabile TaxID=2907820 RepID=UPI001E41F225|nr:non-ribosomal peptide synthetase [Nostoc mirabile]MCC5667073.1 amino acid adenylation domain-containing protein [Nostoc mirabile CHAB5784]